MNAPSPQVIVSGIQPTGNLHLGNYLGAIRNWVRMQDGLFAAPPERLRPAPPPGHPQDTADGWPGGGAGRSRDLPVKPEETKASRAFFFLADLHAITVHNDSAALKAAVREMAATLIAAGIDPARSVLFSQAQVPAHPELAWLLNGTARIGWLNRMTQFKEKSGKNREGASIGLYAYPVLQAADVLLYQATHVPVGEDQKQHLELARDIAAKFNTDFDTDLFTLPAPIIPPAAARIMSLRDGSAKMSKSDPSDMSRINLTDDADAIAQKIRKAKTDPAPLPEDMAGLDARPEARNLVAIHAALADETPADVLRAHAGQGFGAFKPLVAERLIETLRPVTARLDALRADPGELDRLLAAGAARAREAAAPTLAAAYHAMGLRE